MALRKPLVIIQGQIQQIPSSDTLDALVSEVDVATPTNGSGSAVAICTAVYISSSSTFNLARANASGTVEVFGLVKDASINNGTTGAVQTDGLLTATAAQWDSVTGQTGGLTPGAVYYLSSAIAGRITSTAPTAVGEYVARIGRAMSATSLDISIAPPIGL